MGGVREYRTQQRKKSWMHLGVTVTFLPFARLNVISASSPTWDKRRMRPPGLSGAPQRIPVPGGSATEPPENPQEPQRSPQRRPPEDAANSPDNPQAPPENG